MSASLSIAVVGDFQRGKSTLVNCLLGRDAAEMGRGPSTTHENRDYKLSAAVTITDTPGFNANGTDDGTASSAIDKANVVVYVHESKALGETCANVFKWARDGGRQMLFVLNCRNFEKWSPDENADIVATIDAELENKNLKSIMVPINGRIVTPVNILWARFGLGMMDSKSSGDAKDIRKIRSYAEDDLGIPAQEMPEEDFREAMLCRSGFLPVWEFLRNLPLELLKHAVSNPQREIDRIVDRFAAELKRRWSAA